MNVEKGNKKVTACVDVGARVEDSRHEKNAATPKLRN